MTTPAPAPVTEPCRLLEWDTAHWGMPIARVNRDRLDPADLPAIDAWCAARNVACLMLLLGCDDRESAAAAHAAGFFEADVRLTLSRSLAGVPAASRSQRVRPASDEDLPVLCEMAAGSHENTRFFFDRRFPRQASRELYARWIERHHHDAGSVVLAGSLDARLAGYIVATCQPGEARAVIGLIGVASWGRRQGLGGDLLDEALGWCVGQGATSVEMVTQGRNVASQALFQGAGFRTEACATWHHRWSAGWEDAAP